LTSFHVARDSSAAAASGAMPSAFCTRTTMLSCHNQPDRDAELALTTCKATAGPG
jgi:hypothetical protein